MVAQTEATHGTIPRRDGTVTHLGRMDTFWGWPRLSHPQGLRQQAPWSEGSLWFDPPAQGPTTSRQIRGPTSGARKPCVIWPRAPPLITATMAFLVVLKHTT